MEGSYGNTAEVEAYNYMGESSAPFNTKGTVIYAQHQNDVYSDASETIIESSAAGPALTFRVSGIVGLSITGILFIIVSWRMIYHYSGYINSKCCKRKEREEQGQEILGAAEDDYVNHLRVDGFTTKRLLHIMLWITTVIQGIGYANMAATDVSNKLNYTLLDIIGRGILEFTTFVIGTIHWFDVTSQARAGASEKKVMFKLLPMILVLATIAVALCSIFEAVELFAGKSEDLHEFRSTSKIHRITLVVESSGWGIHAVVVAICGRMVYKRISSLPTYSQVRSRARRNIITKMIIPIFFCAISYALRSAWMAADFASRILRPNSTFESGLGWWIGNCWIPTIVPCVMLLYSIRKRDREPGTIDGVPDALLMGGMSHDYDDPFRSFQSLIEDDENATIGSD